MWSRVETHTSERKKDGKEKLHQTEEDCYCINMGNLEDFLYCKVGNLI